MESADDISVNDSQMFQRSDVVLNLIFQLPALNDFQVFNMCNLLHKRNGLPSPLGSISSYLKVHIWPATEVF